MSLADVTSSRKATGRSDLAGDYAEYIINLLKRFYDKKGFIIDSKSILSGAEICHILNLKPSPLIGKLIEDLREAQIEGEIATRQEAIKFLLKRV